MDTFISRGGHTNFSSILHLNEFRLIKTILQNDEDCNLNGSISSNRS